MDPTYLHHLISASPLRKPSTLWLLLPVEARPVKPVGLKVTVAGRGSVLHHHFRQTTVNCSLKGFHTQEQPLHAMYTMKRFVFFLHHFAPFTTGIDLIVQEKLLLLVCDKGTIKKLFPNTNTTWLVCVVVNMTYCKLRTLAHFYITQLSDKPLRFCVSLFRFLSINGPTSSLTWSCNFLAAKPIDNQRGFETSK